MLCARHSRRIMMMLGERSSHLLGNLVKHMDDAKNCSDYI